MKLGVSLVLVLALGLGAVRLLAAGQGEGAAPPNVVLFLADDLGWGDLGCYGHPIIRTPNLDRFAAQGVQFTQCYAACGVCSPSRSAILTGRTPYRNGVFRWIPEGSEVHLRTSEVTLAELLKAQGYQTCHAGKWHLNGHFNSPRHPQPDVDGFDHWFATQNNAAPSHRSPRNFVRNGEPAGELQGYSAQLVAAEAVRWLRARDSAKPFYLQVWTHEPHLPIETDPRFMEPYASLDDPDVRQHHGNVTQMDEAFGTVSRALDELGLAENTIVVFTADNGPEGDGTRGRTRGSTGGLRGRKRDDFEGGIRVPGIVRWPGHIAAGTVSDVPVIGSDLFTTLCAITGAPLPKDRPIDGVDIRSAFAGKPVRRAIPMYWRTHISSPDSRVAVRIDDWKVVGNDALDRFQLFNLKDDPRETTDLAARYPEKLAELKTTLLKLDAEIRAEGPDWWKRDPQPGWNP